MSDKLSQEKELLQEIAARPPVAKAFGYLKLTGPGLLQSGMTLGAGSAAASVIAGASFGYKLLWVQPVAMFLGIMMFAALSNIVLTTRERPYWGFMREFGKIWSPLVVFVFLWAFGSVMASIIWHFPQYGLAAGAVRSVVQQFKPDAELQKHFYKVFPKGEAISGEYTVTIPHLSDLRPGNYTVRVFATPVDRRAFHETEVTGITGAAFWFDGSAFDIRDATYTVRPSSDMTVPITNENLPNVDVEFNLVGEPSVTVSWRRGQSEDDIRSYLVEIRNEENRRVTSQFTGTGYIVSFAAGIIILLINLTVVFNYGRGGIGIKIYEWFMRCVIALVFLTFLLVVAINFHRIEWLEMLKGFIGWYGIPGNECPEEYTNTVILVLGMIGASVGINMTFMYPYTQLKKGWGPEHKTLARWDLGMTMFIPFAVITSLIMIGMTVSGIYDGGDVVNRAITPLQAAGALQSEFISQKVATIIFCAGLIGMACGAIAAHMTVCGFVLTEMFKLEHKTWRFRLFALAPSIGIMGVVLPLPIWFPVVASAIALTMLPIAYLIFLILNNRRSYIGDAVGKGGKRIIFNVLLVAALLVACIGSYTEINRRVVTPIRGYVVEQFSEFVRGVVHEYMQENLHHYLPAPQVETTVGTQQEWSVPITDAVEESVN